MQSPKVDKIIAHMRERFGATPRCELNHANGLQLLVAIVLSAQCTDKRVNMVTPELFKRYPTTASLAGAEVGEIEKLIHSTGFYRAKARNVVGLCRELVKYREKMTEEGGRGDDTHVPNNIDFLTTLPGVGRKSASVFVAEFYGAPAIGVDTHVTRVSRRLGLSDPAVRADVLRIEKDLKAAIDRENWSKVNLYLVLFGRYHCTAKTPKCDTCALKDICVYHNK